MGARGRFLHRMARSYRTNAERDLHAYVRRRVDHMFPEQHMLRPYYVRMPLLNTDVRAGRLGSLVYENIPVILPWEIIIALRRKGDEYVRKILTGSTNAGYTRRFWGNAMAQGWGHSHPIAHIADADREDVFPYFWFLDETKTFSSQGLDACFLIQSWSGAGSSGISRKTKHFCYQVPSWRMAGELTNKAMADFTGWLSRVMMSGERPERGYANELMASSAPSPGFHLLLGGIKSDWSQKHKMHHYVTPSHNQFCELDCANKLPPYLFADFSDAPLWATTAVSDEVHLASAARQSPWLLALRDSGMSMRRHMWDGLHLLYKQGCASDLVGSILVQLAEEEMPVDDAPLDAEGQLLALFEKFANWIKDSKVRAHRMAAWNLKRLCRESPHISSCQ